MFHLLHGLIPQGMRIPVAGFGLSFSKPRGCRVGDAVLGQAGVLRRLSGEQMFPRQLGGDRESISELTQPHRSSHSQLVRQLFHRNCLKLAI